MYNDNNLDSLLNYQLIKEERKLLVDKMNSLKKNRFNNK